MLNRSKSKRNESKESKEESIMYGEYNFPHGVINLEQIKNKVTPEFSKFFDGKGVNLESVNQFLRNFGDIVPTQITLGRKLYVSVSYSDYLEENSTDDKSEEKFKLSARAIIKNLPLDVGYGHHQANRKQESS